MGMVAHESATLTLMQLQMHSGMQPGLMINGAMGMMYRVDFASDLSLLHPWTTLTNFSLPTNSFLLNAPQTSGHMMGFYRVIPGH